MEKIATYLYIAAGSALGGMGRYWISTLVVQRVGRTFPWGTVLVNISGSFLIGLFATLAAVEGRFASTARFREFFMIGICGGYTTFSSFSLETLNLAHEGQWFYAGANAALSVVLCFVAVWLGHLLGQVFNR